MDMHKGQGSFWEKDWGKISAETHRQHTCPVSFKEEKAYISSSCRMELPGMQQRIPNRVCKKEELR
jgi:hypothetical protein